MESLRLRHQLRACWKGAAAVLLIAALVMSAAFVVQFKEGIPLGDLTRDPVSVAGVPLYVGFVSQLGIVLWSATAACCFLAALIVARQGLDIRWRNFFLGAAGLSLMLGLDDLYLLHEVFFPYFGIPELVVFGVYGLLVAVFLGRYLSLLLRSDFLLLAMAFGFLGLSVLADLFDVELIEPYLLEDTLKLIGILGWLCYFARTAVAVATLSARLAESARPAQSRSKPAAPAREWPLASRTANSESADDSIRKYSIKG